MTLFRLALVLLLVALPACSVLNPQVSPTPSATGVTATAGPGATLTSPATTPTSTPGGPLTLRIWLPPQLDPSADTPAGELLRERLLEFTKQRPRVQLDIRVKAHSGAGGLLDALTTASAAAPQAIPDLAALPRDVLETAALKGLLYPFDPAELDTGENDWYPYAQELAHVQDSLYGLPFAGDAMALVYRTESVGGLPLKWSDVVTGTETIVFPAADPQALFTLMLYQSQGGEVRDEQGKPVIETLALTEVLTYFAEAKVTGVMNEGLIQFQSDDQVWAAFVDGGYSMVGTWCSRYLNDASLVMDDAVLLAPPPTSSGRPFSLATGWVWSLASRDPERQRVAVELARFLTDSEFLAKWTEAAGYLPTSPGVLAGWQNVSRQPAVLDQIARSARALPPADILSAVSGPLWQATIDVLKGQNDPLAAAQGASASLTAP